MAFPIFKSYLACNILFLFAIFHRTLFKPALEPVQNLLSNKMAKASTIICKLVFILRSQFFHNLLHFSNHANDLSTTHLLGITANVWSSVRLAIFTPHPNIPSAAIAKFFPVYPESARIFETSDKLSLCNSSISKAPFRSVTLAVVTPTACGRPLVSTAIWRLIPDTFLPAS